MPVTAQLFGPTGAQLENESISGLKSSLEGYKKAKDEAYKRTLEQVWKIAEQTPGGIKGVFLRDKDGKLLRGLDPWIGKGFSQRFAGLINSTDMSPEQMQEMVAGAIATGNLEDFYKQLEGREVVKQEQVRYQQKEQANAAVADAVPEVKPETPPVTLRSLGKVMDFGPNANAAFDMLAELEQKVPPSPNGYKWEVYTEPGTSSTVIRRKLDPNGNQYEYMTATPDGTYGTTVNSPKDEPRKTNLNLVIPMGGGQYSALGPDGKSALTDAQGNVRVFATPEEAGQAAIDSRQGPTARGGYSLVGSGASTPSTPTTTESTSTVVAKPKELTEEERGAALLKIRSTPELNAKLNQFPIGDDRRMAFIEQVAIESRPQEARTSQAETEDAELKDLRAYVKWTQDNPDQAGIAKPFSRKPEDYTAEELRRYVDTKGGSYQRYKAASGGTPATIGQTTPQNPEQKKAEQAERSQTSAAIRRGIAEIRWKEGEGEKLAGDRASQILYAARKMQEQDPNVRLTDEVFMQMRDKPEIARRQARAALANLESQTAVNEENVKYLRAQIAAAEGKLEAERPDIMGMMKQVDALPAIKRYFDSLAAIRIASKGDVKKFREEANKLLASELEDEDFKAWFQFRSQLTAAATGNPTALKTILSSPTYFMFFKTSEGKPQTYVSVNTGGIQPVGPKYGTGAGEALAAQLGAFE